MPFKSKAQKGYLYANNPAVAKEFQAATPKGVRLPEYAKKPTGPKTTFVRLKKPRSY